MNDFIVYSGTDENDELDGVHRERRAPVTITPYERPATAISESAKTLLSLEVEEPVNADEVGIVKEVHFEV